MSISTSESGIDHVSVARPDLVVAWSVLERIVVSLHRMGSYYATNSEAEPLAPDRRREMLDELDKFFSAEFMGDLSIARRLLSSYIPGEEEDGPISDSLNLWQPPPPRNAADA